MRPYAARFAQRRVVLRRFPSRRNSPYYIIRVFWRFDNGNRRVYSTIIIN